MAIGSNLPPQAYTRETLTQAFNWLQSQPDAVKKLAPNPDSLVALYRRSLRYGGNIDLENEAPISSQNFISDLKNLAEGLKQFEEPRLEPQVPAFAAPNSTTVEAPRIGQSPLSDLHPMSRQMLDDLKGQLNLSSDIEAINMMIAIGYKNLKKTIL
jgi:hypothetical protein